MDYGEQICEAASIIAQSAIDKVKLDKTIKVVIEKVNDNQNSAKGEYLCKYENSKFLAYGAPFAYSEGDVVYVLIPMNNWSNKLQIIGPASVQSKKSKVFSGVNVVAQLVNNKYQFLAFAADGTFIGTIGGNEFENYESKSW